MPTPVKINNPDAKNLKVLLAPLDWGLGHVTRCIPVIKELRKQQCTVVAAVSGVQRVVLLREFPDLELVDLPGYSIKYGKNRTHTVFQLIFSIPKILIRVNRENAWLQQWISAERPDLVISDNRYGLYSSSVPSVFMTHQLLIKTPLGGFADRVLQRLNYGLISRFSFCWVPDRPGMDGLAGELSHPSVLPAIPVRYVGWLSRMGAYDMGGESFDLLVLLSGPEPQRSVLERMIVEQLESYTGKVVLVRGLPGDGEAGAVGERELRLPERVRVYNHLAAAELEVLMRNAGQIVARSGYSTVMDLMRVGRSAILVPTPGQTEQEYLGHYLASKGWCVCVEQRGFSLVDALAVARGMEGDGGRSGMARSSAGEDEDRLREAVEEVLRVCREG